MTRQPSQPLYAAVCEQKGKVEKKFGAAPTMAVAIVHSI